MTSGTGVAFTRDPATGEKHLMGEFLMNAQGEDVVAGVRTPQKIAQLAEKLCRKYYEQFDEDLQYTGRSLQRYAGYGVYHRGQASCTCCRPVTVREPQRQL